MKTAEMKTQFYKRARNEMKTAEMKIQFYAEGKKTFCRVLMFDNRKLIFRDVSCVDSEVLALLAHAENVREKFEKGGFDYAKKQSG